MSDGKKTTKGKRTRQEIRNEMGPPVRPPLEDKIKFLMNEALPELNLKSNKNIVERMAGRPGAIDVKRISQLRTGYWHYLPQHIAAVHQTFGLHHFGLESDVWGKWSEDKKQFIAVSDEVFKQKVLEAIKRDGDARGWLRKDMAKQAKAEQAPALQLMFERKLPPPSIPSPQDDRFLPFGYRGKNAPPVEARFHIGEICRVVCEAPSDGHIAIITSVPSHHQVTGALYNRYACINRLIRLQASVPRSSFRSPLMPIEPPDGMHELLAFFWPAGTKLPHNAAAWIFGHDPEPREFDYEELRAMMHMILDGREFMSAAKEANKPASTSHLPEVTLIDYLIYDSAAPSDPI
ncbi:hypothetical protein [Teichococcus aestuarii]|uniref:hypothetical protein n=1 Tax=Teichococcus aestuarii TaxID=568898 RepID=UPI0011B1E7B3|nr:hypothetical protein [Pseudoroseomonas aestuarii]